MRIREILFEVRIYNRDYLDNILHNYSNYLPQQAKEFIKRIINKEAQDQKNQNTPKLKPDATEWDKKDLANGTLVDFKLSNELENKLSHIRHWLRHPDITEQELNSLRGIQNIDIAYEHADRFFAKLNKKASDEEDESGLETIMTWPDGFKLVKLNTAKCLNREGKLMQHCVGSYARKIKGRTEILSLRDPQNNPHVTIEKNGNDIEQIKGKNNKAPIEKYHKYIVDYLNKNNFNEIYDLKNIGLIKVNDKIYELRNLPDGITINGNLDLSYLDVKELPENLTVNGMLDIKKTLITKLPNGLKITSSLYADHSALETLPDDLEVGGHISINNTEIKELPKSWNRKTINGYLDIRDCPIKELPNGLKITGSLYADWSTLKSLPDDLEIQRHINIYNTKIKKLPKSWEGKTINGYLDISRCQIKELPENLTVLGRLDIKKTLITKLPDGLKVTGLINISRNMNLTYVPDHLKDKIKIG